MRASVGIQLVRLVLGAWYTVSTVGRLQLVRFGIKHNWVISIWQAPVDLLWYCFSA